MTNPHHTQPAAAEADTAAAGWWDRAAILALGGAGCALSYDALQQMAIAIHVRPQLSYLFPLVIDGFIAYGIRALLVMSTAPLRARLYTWTLFATATTASIWANALHAVRLNQQTHHGGLRLGDHIVAVLSTIAPLALAGAVHLYILITRHHPTRDTAKDQAGPDRPRTLAAVRADSDGTIRTGSRDPLRADRTHAHAHGLKARRTTDRGPDHRTSGPDRTGGPDQMCGPQRGPADHGEPGPPERTGGPRGDRADHNAAGHEPSDRQGGDHSGPNDHRPSVHGTATADAQHSFEPADDNPDPADRPRDHAERPATEPQTATEPAPGTGPEATAPDPEEVSAAQPPSHEPVADQEHDLSALKPSLAERPAETEDTTDARADQNGEADHDRGQADHSWTAGGDQSPQGTGGPDRADHQSGDHHPVGDHAAAHDGRTGPEPEDVGDRPQLRTTDRTGTEAVDAAQEAGEVSGLEELLAIAREAALAEGRMTRRALRPYLNQAGVPISNSRFTELQRRLYADPKLAHLPRPGRRT